jgi:hypothetical protein
VTGCRFERQVMIFNHLYHVLSDMNRCNLQGAERCVVLRFAGHDLPAMISTSRAIIVAVFKYESVQAAVAPDSNCNEWL